MQTFMVEAHWPVTYAVRETIRANSLEDAKLRAVAMLANDEIDFEAQQSCDDSEGPTSLTIWNEQGTQVLAELPADEERVREAAPALLSALRLFERHLPALEAEGFIGDGDVIAVRAALAKAGAS